MINLTVTELSKVTGARIDRAETNLPHLLRAMDVFLINTSTRIAMFCAQIGHESGGLKHSFEIWGPTAQQNRYERNFDEPWPSSIVESRQPEFSANRLAYGLGNEMIGDGYKFRGHGWMQVTGRNNHAVAQKQLMMAMPGQVVPDFIQEPGKLSEPLWAAMSAGNFWHVNRLNRYADANDFDGVSDAINIGRKTQAIGDSNGYAHRLALYQAGAGILA